MTSGKYLRAWWYLHYIIQAKGLKYIHSPFLFKLMSEAFADRDKDLFTEIEMSRRSFLQDSTEVLVNDLGGGSFAKLGNVRTVRTIAGGSLLPARNARLLFRMAGFMKARNFLELGTSLGITTRYFSMAAGDSGKVVTLEGCDEIANRAQAGFDQAGLHNICVVRGDFDRALPGVLKQFAPIDFAFIDGNHREEPTYRYFTQLLPSLHSASVVVFDDIFWSEGMRKAWQRIVDHPKVTLSFDVYRMGFVFLNPDLSKENFRLRY